MPTKLLFAKHHRIIRNFLFRFNNMAFLFSFVIILLHTKNICAQQYASKASAATTAFFQAIRSGNTDELNRELAKGANVNDTMNGYTALMAAAISGTVDQIKILIDHGAHINDTTARGVSALWLAVPDFEKTKFLLDHGADIKQKAEGYGILVKLAIMPGTIKLFQLLIASGADPKNSAPDNFLVYNAASSGDTSILGTLIRYGLSVDDSIYAGDRPINAALIYRTFPTLKMLVDNGANVNIRFPSAVFKSYVGITPLMFAALNYDKPSFFYLLDHGADPNLKNNKGYTALMLLQQAETEDAEMTLALINHGATVSLKAQDGSDAISLAERKGNTQSLALLKKYSSK